MEGGRKGEKQQYVVASRTPPTGDLACNPGMCPRLGIFGTVTLWFGGLHSTTEPNQPGLKNNLEFNDVNDLFVIYEKPWKVFEVFFQ